MCFQFILSVCMVAFDFSQFRCTSAFSESRVSRRATKAFASTVERRMDGSDPRRCPWSLWMRASAFGLRCWQRHRRSGAIWLCFQEASSLGLSRTFRSNERLQLISRSWSTAVIHIEFINFACVPGCRPKWQLWIMQAWDNTRILSTCWSTVISMMIQSSR